MLVVASVATAPATASAVTYSVGPNGNDANAGTAQEPFRTITRAAQVARTGDAVLVASGRYQETVQLRGRHTGVTFRGVGATRPLIDGGKVRARGFDNNGANRVTIENFEIAGQTQAGIFTAGSGNAIVGNVVHHVGSPLVRESQGVRVNRGSGNRVARNTIHHIGPGAASVGIWLLESRDGLVEGNTVYLARKEGMRDWKGLDNTLRDNRSYLNWVGISLNTSTGSTVIDNLVYENVQGIVAKHTSYATVLRYWGLRVGKWTTVTHNTVLRSTDASLWIAQSEAPLDYLDVRENFFSGAGTAFLRDAPSLRGPNVKVDTNAYSSTDGRPNWLYKAGYRSTPGVPGWGLVRSLLGWELNPPPADVGARGLAEARPRWKPYPMQAVDSSSKGTYYTRTHLDKTSDNDQSSYWLTAGNSNEYVTFDLGQRRTFNHLILTLHDGAEDLRYPRRVKFAVSTDGATWRTVHRAVNPDPNGAAHYYELRKAARARYLRYTMVDTHCTSTGVCGEYFVVSDLEAGLLPRRFGHGSYRQ
jgi:parallel beta-helix repeat protein